MTLLALSWTAFIILSGALPVAIGNPKIRVGFTLDETTRGISPNVLYMWLPTLINYTTEFLNTELGSHANLLELVVPAINYTSEVADLLRSRRLKRDKETVRDKLQNCFVNIGKNPHLDVVLTRHEYPKWQENVEDVDGLVIGDFLCRRKPLLSFLFYIEHKPQKVAERLGLMIFKHFKPAVHETSYGISLGKPSTEAIAKELRKCAHTPERKN